MGINVERNISGQPVGEIETEAAAESREVPAEAAKPVTSRVAAEAAGDQVTDASKEEHCDAAEEKEDAWKNSTAVLTNPENQARMTHSQRSVEKSVRDHGQSVSTTRTYQKGALEISTRDTSSYVDGHAVKRRTDTTADGKTEHSRTTKTVTTAAGADSMTVEDQKGVKKPRQDVHAERSSKAETKFVDKNFSAGGKELAGSHARYGTETAGADLNAEVKGPAAALSMTASGQFEKNEVVIDAHLHISADALSAGAGAKGHYQFTVEGKKFELELSAEALAKIGADGDLDLKIVLGKEGAKIEAAGSLFAGAKGELALKGAIKAETEPGKFEELASLEGKVTLAAGLGVAGYARTGFEHGKVDFKYGYNVTVGLGGGVTVEGTVDPLTLGKVSYDLTKTAVENGDLAKLPEAAAHGVWDAGVAVNNWENEALGKGFDSLMSNAKSLLGE